MDKNIRENLINCAKAGMSILVVGNADIDKEKIIDNMVKEHLSRDKTVLYVDENNKDSFIKELKPIVNTVIYPNIKTAEEVFDIVKVNALGHQIITSIHTENEVEALYRLIGLLLIKDNRYTYEIFNNIFDLIILFKRNVMDKNNIKIFRVSIPAIEGKYIEAKSIIEYKVTEKEYKLNEDILEFKKWEEKILKRGVKLNNWI